MNVLILTDFSKVAENAGNYALHFLRNVPANFCLLNIENATLRSRQNEKSVSGREAAIKKLKKRLGQLQDLSDNKNHTFQVSFSEDNLVNATRKCVEEKKIDLIVMGAAGRDSRHNVILGNHTYEIIRKVRCNLLAIPEGSTYRELKKIVLPLDYSASIKEDVFRFFENGVGRDSHFTIMEIGKTRCASEGTVIPERRVFEKLEKREMNFLQMQESVVYSEDLLLQAQKEYNMIVILAKNLNVSDKLLHTKYGICTSISNKLPILVLHE